MKVQITTNEGIPVGTVTEDYEVSLDETEVPVTDRERLHRLIGAVTTGDTATTPGAEQGDLLTPPEESVEYPPRIGLQRVAWIIPAAGPYQANIEGEVAKQDTDDGQTLEIRDYYRVWLSDPNAAEIPDDVMVLHAAEGGPAGNKYYYEVPFETTTSVDIGKQDPREWRPADRTFDPDDDDLVACGVPDSDLQLVNEIDPDTTPRAALYERVESPITLMRLYKWADGADAVQHQQLIKAELDRREIAGIERLAKVRRDD